MSGQVLIDASTGWIARYPYPVNQCFSPPAAWDRTLAINRDPVLLSPFMEKRWANLDVALVPALVPPPPSSADAEIRDLFALKALRNACAPRINEENDPHWSPFAFLLRRLTQVQADLTQDLGGQSAGEALTNLSRLVATDAKCLALNQKALFNRERPWQAAHTVHPMFLPGHPSYPSGHSTVCHAMAWTFAMVLAGTRYSGIAGGEFVDYASGAAQRREMAGVHYRSDTVAGMALARFIVDRYEQSADFHRKYTDVIGAMQ